MNFNYVVKDKNSKISRGVIDAEDKKAASMSLSEKDFYVISISEKTEQKLSFLRKKISLKDKIIFTEQLAIMIRSGLSIIEALEALQEETQNKYFYEAIGKIISSVEGGAAFSKSLSMFPDIFSEIYISMVDSGEKSGKVDEVLTQLASQLEKDYELTRKIRGALSYPIFVMIALVAVMVLILTYIIPQLKLIFEDSGVKLPVMTRVIIGLSEYLKVYGLYIFIALFILIVLLMRWRKTASGRKTFDKAILKLPVFGVLLKKTYMARFSRTFASLTASGLPLLEVFKVSGNTIGNVVYQEEIEKIAQKVQSGQPVSITLKQSEIFPKMIGQLSTVGEKSGNLDEVFVTLANFFERDVDNITANLSAILEPLLMVVLGVGIGLIIVSVLQPIYGLVNAI